MSIREQATEIVTILNKAGYIAYFAGGWVRDYLLEHQSTDIDIATSAPPERILELFPHTALVGLAFGVVIVTRHGHSYEVATFRKDVGYTGGRRPEKIELTTPEEDASRRDFTINGMFYNPLKDVVLDYVNGTADLKAGIIRTIGNPHDRFVEDRLRMIRAVRFSARFDFPIEHATKQAIKDNAHTLFPAVAMERIWQEFNKMAKSPRFDLAIIELHRLGLLQVIFPALSSVSTEQIAHRVACFKEFPQGSPTILYIMELFHDEPLEELLEICQYLKVSGFDSKLVEFAYKGRRLFRQDEASHETVEVVEWANFYAHRFFDVCFDVMAARISEEKRSSIVERHLERRDRLLPHIQRIAEKKPLVTATVLQSHGIAPGKQMGALLKAAENIAIEHDLHDETAVITRLKKTPLWPDK